MKAILGFSCFALAVFAVMRALELPAIAAGPWLYMAVGTVLLGAYAFFAWRDIKRQK